MMGRSLLIRLSTLALAKPVSGGSNGMAMTPPLTWRSWNQYGWYIDQEVMMQAAKGLLDKSRPIKGMPAGSSLRDIGFDQVGMDEGWAACPASTKINPKSGYSHGRDPTVDPRAAKQRTNVSQPFSIGGGQTAMYHRANADGSISPVVDTLLFPDMKGMVDEIHGMGLYVGWYLNDCLSYCESLGDRCSAARCIPGDVDAFISFGFDALKVDGCSAQHNVTGWAELIYAAGNHNLTLEDCGNGPRPSKPISEGGCPDYHQYRTSGDINNAYSSWVRNAQTVAPFATTGRSGPTCWAYPDMLMIGVQGGCPDEGQTHGGGPWSNGFVQPSVTEQRTHFGLWCTLSAPLTLSLDFTNKTATDSVWHIITNRAAIAVNQAWAGHPGTTFLLKSTQHRHRVETVTLEPSDGPVPTLQAWYKPLAHGGAAVFVANHGPAAADVSIEFADVPGLGPPAPPPHCDAAAFESLGDTQCMGLQGPAIVDGVLVSTAEGCCAACSAAGAACETWGFCGQGQQCASVNPTHPPGSPGCFWGRSSNCVNRTDGWVAQKRSGPAPAPPSPAPKRPVQMYKVTDVWEQATLAGVHSNHSVAALASHDSIFLTLSPA